MDISLRQQINAALASLAASAPILLSKGRTDKLYEIFVMTCVLRALRQIGATFEPRDGDDRVTNVMFFRLAPGLIYSPTTSPGFIFVRYRGREYELQNSLRVCGRSRVRHELDVCLITRLDAQRCRTAGIDPSQTSIKFLAECKFYGNSLPLHLGREFVGLCTEFAMRTKVIVSNESSDEIHSLVTKHRLTENFNITPMDRGRVDIFVNWLANEFRQVL